MRIQFRRRNYSGPLFRILLFFFITISIPFEGFGQLGIPRNNNDIENIISKIKVYHKLAQQCNRYDCPDFDCEQAQKVFNDLRDARKYMRHTLFWLDLYNDTYMNHFMSLAEQGLIALDEIERVERRIAHQEQVKLLFGTLLDFASASANVKELVEDFFKPGSLPLAEKLIDLSKFYEIGKDVVQIQQGWNDAFSKPTWKPLMFEEDIPNEVVSSIADLLAVAYEYSEEYGNLRELAVDPKFAKSRIGLLSILGRVAKSGLERSINEKNILVDSLRYDLEAIDYVQTGAFNNYQWHKVRARKFKAEDAFNLLDELLVVKSDTQGDLTRCFKRGSSRCASFDLNYASRLEIPKRYHLFNKRDKLEQDSLQITKALLFFNEKLKNEIPNLLDEDLRVNPSIVPELELTKKIFNPKESITLKFEAPSCLPNSSWIGIIPAEISSWQEEENRRNRVGDFKYFRGKKEGEYVFEAPEKPGWYEFRMFDTDKKTAIRSVSFEVKEMGELSMKVFDKNDEEVEFFVRIFKDGEYLKAVDGLGLLEELSPGNYKLKFYVNDEEIDRSANVKINDTAFIEIHLKEDEKVEEDEVFLLPSPPRWSTGILYNSNNGDCSYGGEYLVFMSAGQRGSGRFLNRETGEFSQFVAVAPGKKLEVAVPKSGIFIRVFSTKVLPEDLSTVPWNSISFGTMSNLVDGWWYQAGCKNGTKPKSSCDNGSGSGPSGGSCKTFGED